MDTTNKLKEEIFLTRMLGIRKELLIELQPQHAIHLIKYFTEYMQEVDEIPIKNQDFICNVLNVLERRIEKRIKFHCSGSSLESIKLQFYSVSREQDFKVIRKYPGPLRDNEKLEVLESLKNILENLLTSEALDNAFRGEWTYRFCACICNIPRKLVLRWITSSKRVHKINKELEYCCI